jgi:hypothetical protein
MEHYQLKFGVFSDFFLVKIQYFALADTQSGCVEFEVGLFLGGHSEADFTLLLCDELVVITQFLGIVAHRNNIVETVIDESGDFFSVQPGFVPVIDDGGTFIDFALFVQLPDQVNIKGRRGFQLSAVFEHFIQDKGKMRTFGTVAVHILSVVVIPLNGIPEQFSCVLNFFTDFGKVSKFEWCPVPLNQVMNIYSVEKQAIGIERETVLREIKGLRYEIVVGVFHRRFCRLPVFADLLRFARYAFGHSALGLLLKEAQRY